MLDDPQLKKKTHKVTHSCWSLLNNTSIRFTATLRNPNRSSLSGDYYFVCLFSMYVCMYAWYVYVWESIYLISLNNNTALMRLKHLCNHYDYVIHW